MLKSNLLCALIALITAVTISSAFAKGYLMPSEFEITTMTK
jgi:hypothetical protein